MRKRITAVLAAGLVVASLAGCSGIGGQSKADACKVIGNTIGSNLSAATSSSGSSSLLTSMKKAEKKVTNSQVKPVLTEYVNSYTKVMKSLKSLSSLSGSGSASSSQGEAAKLLSAGKKLEKLCG